MFSSSLLSVLKSLEVRFQSPELLDHLGGINISDPDPNVRCGEVDGWCFMLFLLVHYSFIYNKKGLIKLIPLRFLEKKIHESV